MSGTNPADDGWDLEGSPFHEGGLLVQRRVGVEDRMAAVGQRSIRRYLTQQHREFFPLLPMVFVGSVAGDGQPWASMLMGRPGFVAAPDAHHLRVEAVPLFGDRLAGNVATGAHLAILGIELPTRRRNRAIGEVEAAHASGFTLSVRQTIGICAKYIQGRETAFVADPTRPEHRPVVCASELDSAATAIVAASDCFFIASNDPIAAHGVSGGPDISHRGGRPGFVRVDDSRTLTSPDFIGNFVFNTLGNLEFERRVGLLFIDFEIGDTLQISAEAEVIWDGEAVRSFAGAQRLVRFHVSEVLLVRGGVPARFSQPDYSPFLARTGIWQDAEAHLV